jgi:hypothetical protein
MGTFQLKPRAQTGAAPVESRRGRAARGFALLAALALFALPNLRTNVAPLAGGDAVIMVHDCAGQGCNAPADWGPGFVHQDLFFWAAN